MTLTVLNVAYPLATVTSDAVGGAEQVLAAVDRALVASGARSVVIACEGSRVAGQLHATPVPAGAFDGMACAAARDAHARAITEVLDRHPVDVIHFHGVDFHSYLPEPGVTALATLHLAHCWYPFSAIAPSRPDTFVHCVSEWQRQFFPTSPAMLPTIGNGVPIPAGPALRHPRHYVVALGRICPEKGFHLALDAARRAGIPMKLAGRVFAYPAHEAYFHQEITPRLNSEREFVGPVGATEKQRLLAHARCVLVPSLVPETSSLVSMEALAAGVPVIAFANGALVETIEHGVTGFIVHDEREMAEAIGAVGDLDPETCRARAIERFSDEAMTRKYLALYETLATHRRTTVSTQCSPVSILARRRSEPQIVEIRRATELRALAPEWARLCATADCTPFQRPEWLLPWWDHFGTGELRVIAVRQKGELVGLAPLHLRRGWQGERELAFVGAGNTDYLDVIAAAAERDEIVSAVIERIVSWAGEWDRCDLGPLSARSPMLAVLMPNGWRAPRAPLDVCPLLCASSPRGNLLDAASPRLVDQLRYARRRLGREHAVDVREATPGNAVALLADVCRLHAARWRARGTSGVLTDESTRAFHEDAVRGMAEAGLLRLYVLTIDDRPAAGFYGFANRQRWFYYLGGFDPAFARYSVGSLVILHALEQAAAAHATEFDFLRGAEAYKYRWGAVDGRVYHWELTPVSTSASGAAA